MKIHFSHRALVALGDSLLGTSQSRRAPLVLANLVNAGKFQNEEIFCWIPSALIGSISCASFVPVLPSSPHSQRSLIKHLGSPYSCIICKTIPCSCSHSLRTPCPHQSSAQICTLTSSSKSQNYQFLTKNALWPIFLWNSVSWRTIKKINSAHVEIIWRTNEQILLLLHRRNGQLGEEFGNTMPPKCFIPLIPH